MKIKILGISGSPRHGNTDIMVLEALKSAENEGAETEFVSLVNKKMGPCISCKKCHDNHGLCFQQDDWAQIHKKFRSSEGVIIGSPVYVGTVTSQLKAFMDRHFSERIFLIENEKYLKPYIGGAIAVGAGRHGGQEDTLHQIRVFLEKKGAFVVGIRKPHKQLGATGHADSESEVLNDKWKSWRTKLEVSSLEGARDLGKNVARASKIFKAGLEALDL